MDLGPWMDTGSGSMGSNALETMGSTGSNALESRALESRALDPVPCNIPMLNSDITVFTFEMPRTQSLIEYTVPRV